MTVRTFLYVPQPDITALELAMILGSLCFWHDNAPLRFQRIKTYDGSSPKDMLIAAWPHIHPDWYAGQDIGRHFVEIKND